MIFMNYLNETYYQNNIRPNFSATQLGNLKRNHMTGHRGVDDPDHDLQKEKDVRDPDQNPKRSPLKKSKKDTVS